jgi:hypothetical protein
VVVQTQVHSTAKRAAAIIAFAVILALTLIGLRRLASEGLDSSTASRVSSTGATASYIAPIISLRIVDASKESAWSNALAQTLAGRTEVPVPNGRIDVLSENYAIEVDRLDKWHEGIGQAAHYGLAMNRIACLALIIDSDRWPLNETTISKLRTIEQTALAKGVKLLILRRLPADA